MEMIELHRELDTISADQRAHFKRVLHQFANEASFKYALGAKEHGGTLESISPMALLGHAIDEAIDLVVYLYTMRQLIEKAAIEAGVRIATANDPDSGDNR